jgi:hypothetical protein
VNPALVAPTGTVTVFGTVTAELLLDRFTFRPLGAAVLSVTVQASVPDPVMAPLMQDSALNAGGVAMPVPVREITAVPFVEALLATVSCPVAVPLAAGLNCTFRLKVPPADMVTGKSLEATTEKGCPVKLSFVISTGAEPPFTRETAVLAV